MPRLLNHRALPTYQWPHSIRTPAAMCLRRYRTLSRAPHIKSTNKPGTASLLLTVSWSGHHFVTSQRRIPVLWVQGQVSLATEEVGLLCLFSQVSLYTVSTAHSSPTVLTTQAFLALVLTSFLPILSQPQAVFPKDENEDSCPPIFLWITGIFLPLDF